MTLSAEKVAANMEIYEAARAVPNEAQKPFNNGKFSGTDINPMWRLKKLTELYGPSGDGWYIEVTRMDTMDVDGEIFAIVNINLYTKTASGAWSKPIFGTGGNKLKSKTRNGVVTSDEGFKMAYTDAISVACKALGIGADIYFSNDKSSKYSAYYTDGAGDGQKQDEEPRDGHGRTNTLPQPQNGSGGRTGAQSGITDAQLDRMYRKGEAAGYTREQVDARIGKKYALGDPHLMTRAQYDETCAALDAASAAMDAAKQQAETGGEEDA